MKVTFILEKLKYHNLFLLVVKVNLLVFRYEKIYFH